jgi:diguanylate cyclase (GGDEF)-like protein
MDDIEHTRQPTASGQAGIADVADAEPLQTGETWRAEETRQAGGTRRAEESQYAADTAPAPDPRKFPSQSAADASFWHPQRDEIVTQFFTRYLFFALALTFFAAMDTIRPVMFSIEALLIALCVYVVLNTWHFWRALKHLTLNGIRAAMATDLVIVTLCVIHDPHPIPPSALAFLMVLLGNGMRYGMRLFAEVLGGALAGMAIAFAIRYRYGGFEMGAGDVFLGIFWVTIAIYAYILMGRIEAQRRQLDYRSRYDTLTGLLNRHGLAAAAGRVFDSAHPSATVLFADLNEFKAINDRYGHLVGDRVLAEFAQIFHESAEMGVCGRWGGDEFVAILPRRDAAAMTTITNRIADRIAIWTRANGLPMAVSLGVAHAPDDGSDLDTLLNAADAHLYRDKSRRVRLPQRPHARP